MPKISYHDDVKVKLTDEGKAIFKMQYGHDPRIDKDGFYEEPLWVIIHIFGPYIKTHPDIFEGCCIYSENMELNICDIHNKEANLNEICMNAKTAVLLSAYTGYMLTKNPDEVLIFCAELLGRPLGISEWVTKEVQEEIRAKCHPMILKMIENEV